MLCQGILLGHPSGDERLIPLRSRILLLWGYVLLSLFEVAHLLVLSFWLMLMGHGPLLYWCKNSLVMPPSFIL